MLVAGAASVGRIAGDAAGVGRLHRAGIRMAVDGVGPGSAEVARYDASQAMRMTGNSVD
jgi:hypothetical protein